MKNMLAYLDEYGTNELDVTKDGVSTHFLITGVLVHESKEAELVQKIEPIAKKHFQSGEMKSKKIGDNDNRRVKVLTDLAGLDFNIYLLVVDKPALFGEGLRHKKSFYTFINGLLYNDLYRLYPDLQLFTDEHGTLEYMDGFAKYVNKKHIPGLFTGSTFQFLQSKSTRLIQLADMLSGTFARCFDKKAISMNSATFLKILSRKMVAVKEWPQTFSISTVDLADEGKYDPTIAELGLNLAATYREKILKSKDENETDQLACLNHLLFHFRYISPNRYVWQRELIENIEHIKNKRLTSRYFMSKVIAMLRNKGVIISSSTKGYKLPANEGDLYAFLKHNNSIIKPMIDRIKICRDSIKAATLNKLDILNKPEFEYLKKVLD